MLNLSRRGLILGALATPALAHPSEYFETDTVLNPQVPVTDGSIREWRTIYRIQLPPLLPGDILKIDANCVVASGHSYNIHCQEVLTVDPGWVLNNVDVREGGHFISRIVGNNFDPQIHYYVAGRSENFKMPVPMDPAFINYRVRLRTSDTRRLDTHICTVLQNHGRMSMTIERAL